MKVTYYVASSLDGYIAKQDGDVAWLEELGIAIEDTGYEEFYASVDGIFMGRKTYDMIVSFGDWPYGDKPVWVCSSTAVAGLKDCNLQAEHALVAAVTAARHLGIKHLWCVGGGSLAASLLEQNFLTDVAVSIMPILLGRGIKLFAPFSGGHRLTTVAQRHHESGMVQIEYTVESGAPQNRSI